MQKNTPILFSCFTIACLALWHAPSAQAQLLVYEGFDYDADASFPNSTDGALNGGIGWEDGWTTTQFVDGDPDAPPNPYQAILANGMNYTDSQGNQLETSGGALDYDGDFWGLGTIAAPLRNFDMSPTGPAGMAGLLNPNGSLGKFGTTIWMSVLFEGRDEFALAHRPTAGNIGTRDLNLSGRNRSIGFGRPVALKLDGTVPPGDPFDSDDPNEAYGIGRSDDNVIRNSPSGELGVIVGSGVPAGKDLTSGVGQTAVKVFMVLKLDFNGTFDEIAEGEFNLAAGDYGTNVSAWINPDLDADLENDPLGPKSGINFANEFNMWEISFTQISTGGNADLTTDEFRVGATYADVAPIDTSTGLDGDFDLDGDVDGADFLLWQRDTSVGSLADWQTEYGNSTGAAVTSVVPEPSAVVLTYVTLAGFAGCGAKRRR